MRTSDQVRYKRVKLVAIVFLIAVAFSAIPNATAYSVIEKNDATINVYLGDNSDENVQLAQQTFVEYYVDVELLEMDMNPLDQSGKVVIFAHGNEMGIILNQEFISWKDLATMIESSPANRLYVMACFSDYIFNYLSEDEISRVIGLNGEVDAVIAGIIPAYFETESSPLLLELTNTVIDRVTSISKGEIKAQTLADSESGCKFGYKKEYYKKSKWGVTYHKENILWFNLDHTTGLILDITSHIGMELLVHKLVSAGIVSGPVGWVITGVLVVQLILVTSTSYNRIRHDYMFGVSGVLIPVPAIRFWYHWGDDNYRGNGRFAIPVPGPQGILLYNAFSGISSSWRCIIS